MDADDLAAWLKEMKLSQTQAALRLGTHRTSIQLWLKTGAPFYIGLACAALSAGIGPYLPPIARRLGGPVKRRPTPEPEPGIPWKKASAPSD
jgi:hypothetical protein